MKVGIVKIGAFFFCGIAKPWIASSSSTTLCVQAHKEWCWAPRNDEQGNHPFYIYITIASVSVFARSEP